MIRRFMRFEIQRRKAVRKSWHDIRAALVIQADQHARMAEQVAWQHMQEAVQVGVGDMQGWGSKGQEGGLHCA